MNIVVLNNNEDFLQFLDPELCDVTETIEKDGLRTIQFNYKFQDLIEDKRLFRIGNKIWLQGDPNLSDCLYIINTKVKQDIYDENSFSFDAEEVLVELNNAPVFAQTELTSNNGFTFSTNNNNNEYSVVVNWQALHYWFGEYFNIGVVQDCLSTYNQKVGISGTVNLMSLLRQIEEETGNVFVTRYEKDILNNTIHRYLDFLNPISVDKKWDLILEYDFLEEDDTIYVFDEDGNFIDDEMEDVEDDDDIVIFTNEDTNAPNIVPEDCIFRITSSEELVWEGSDLPFDDDYPNVLLTLKKRDTYIGMTVNYKSYSSGNVGGYNKAFTIIDHTTTQENRHDINLLKDDSFFEIYDTVSEKVIFRTRINSEVGHVHEEVLDFGFNVENIELEFDESETCTGVAPVLVVSEDESGITRADMSTLITQWKNLEVSKGEIIPMILEKVSVETRYYTDAAASFGTYSRQNYFTRDFNPQDQLSADSPNSNKWEFVRGTSYYRAPFNKKAGDLHITTDSNYDVSYQKVNKRPDMRDERNHKTTSPKIANVETTMTTLFEIYNVCANKLREHQTPGFELDVDVANLRDGKYNDYELHDKVYVKIPDFHEVLTARVVKTEKDLHDPGNNNVELNNYSIHTMKQIPSETFIDAPNVNFKYPKTSKITARLVNSDYNSLDPNTGAEYPQGKLLTFTIIKVDENNSLETTSHTYTKVTNNEGKATLNLKGNPGTYKIQISFGGDEEYLDCTSTVDMSIGGVLPEPKKKEKTVKGKKTKQKTTKKTSKTKTKTLTTYWHKYGMSPDGKYLVAVGRPSASGELGKYGYKFYKTVFVRKCPMCGSTELFWSIFWGKSEKSNWGTFPATGRNESGSAEGQIFCKKCDADFSIFGKNHNPSHKGLKVYKKPVKSSKSEAYTLKKGRLVYEKKTVNVKQKKNTSNKERTYKGNPSKYVQRLAKNIVGDSTGLAAAKKIAAWFGDKKNWKYELYANFHRSPDKVLKKGRGNCCDTTRAMLTLMDAAGCTEKLTLKYVHVSKSNGVGHVFAKVITKSTGNWRYVDPCKQYNGAWGHYVHGYGSPPGTQTEYPTQPFN